MTYVRGRSVRYRRIPGDVCENTGHSPFTTTLSHEVDLKRQCDVGDEGLLEAQVKDKYLESDDHVRTPAFTADS